MSPAFLAASNLDACPDELHLNTTARIFPTVTRTSGSKLSQLTSLTGSRETPGRKCCCSSEKGVLAILVNIADLTHNKTSHNQIHSNLLIVVGIVIVD